MLFVFFFVCVFFLRRDDIHIYKCIDFSVSKATIYIYGYILQFPRNLENTNYKIMFTALFCTQIQHHLEPEPCFPFFFWGGGLSFNGSYLHGCKLT